MAVQRPGERTDLRAMRGGLGLFLASQSVVFVTLIAARYLTAGGNIGPWSETLGAVITLFILISGLLARSGRQAILRGDNRTMQSRIRTGFWFGVLAVAGVWLQWILFGQQAVPVTLPTRRCTMSLRAYGCCSLSSRALPYGRQQSADGASAATPWTTIGMWMRLRSSGCLRVSPGL